MPMDALLISLCKGTFSSILPHYSLFKLKQPVLLPKLLWHIGVWVMLVEKLYGMETAAVDVEVDIAAVEIRGAGFPHFYFSMHGFYGFPDGLADTLALNAHLHIEECQFASLSRYRFIVIQKGKSALRGRRFSCRNSMHT